jgi:Immunity protein 70
MSLYLGVFAGEHELAGLEVGSYADFNALRQTIARVLEGGSADTRFPSLMLHSDCEGEWAVSACAQLREELATIVAELAALPPLPFPGNWQESVARACGRKPGNASESFIDVDGEFLLPRLQGLVEAALTQGQPILFQ